MISIMTSLHSYVPTTQYQKEYHIATDEVDVCDEFLNHNIILGSDQLTCACARRCQKAKTSKENDRDYLLGLVYVVVDWDNKVCLL